MPSNSQVTKGLFIPFGTTKKIIARSHRGSSNRQSVLEVNNLFVTVLNELIRGVGPILKEWGTSTVTVDVFKAANGGRTNLKIVDVDQPLSSLFRKSKKGVSLDPTKNIVKRSQATINRSERMKQFQAKKKLLRQQQKEKENTKQ